MGTCMAAFTPTAPSATPSPTWKRVRGFTPSTLRGSAGCLTWCPKAGIGGFARRRAKNGPRQRLRCGRGQDGVLQAVAGTPLRPQSRDVPTGRDLPRLSLTNQAGVRQGVCGCRGSQTIGSFPLTNVQYMQVGNAVPLALGEAVGRNRQPQRHWQATRTRLRGNVIRLLYSLRSAARNKDAVARDARQGRLQLR